MIEMTLAEAAKQLGAPIPQGALTFQGISINTRTLLPGNLFIALPGTRTDGHDFIEEAREKGAAAAIVTRPITSDLPHILVADAAAALGTLSRYWRNQFKLPIIAVTGSNGKTTLKNMLAAIMLAACNDEPTTVLATQGTLNNHLGLPLTLAQLNANHRYAVIEMGMNHAGEIAYLTQLTRPQVAIITNAAHAHLEGVGSVEGVARAKAEIFLGLAPDGIAILNRDDAYFTFWREQIGEHRYLTFGFHPDADIRTHTSGVGAITLYTPAGNLTITLPLLGQHNVHNALAATAAAVAIGIDLKSIQRGLEKNEAAPGRLKLHTLANGVNIIDDSYNANPFSLKAAIQTLATFDGKKILVLGDMQELGRDATTLHQEAGSAIRQAGIDYLFTFGELSAHTAQTFGAGAYHFNEQDKLVTALKPFLYNQTTILIKGSRSMQMEKVVAGLINDNATH